ncbi:sugar ABC transporter permease [Helicobacter jaachi]|uniref:Sugar ABC transporter permease n=1 Tax=Helicobacter jaachi TaxID=1677920 RepID=A0A4U8T980_9HELI|nr:sugar ABC transporter permease [Helicobacter jaachi]TLD96336.1 sugar ABC transporter permease [Helicobacter jaachi]
MKKTLSTFCFVSPAFILMMLFLILPILSVVVLSFTDWQLGNTDFKFIGFDNYVAMFKDDVFFTSLKNTLIYVGLVLPISVLGGLFIALLIESRASGKAFYRTVFFLPVMATLIAMSIVWEYILHPDIGILNKILALFGVQGSNWLANRDTVLYVLAGIGIWQQLGYNMVLFTAGLMAIPSHLYDAAKIDGIEGFAQFRLITWPLLGPMLLFVVIITSIKAFQVFDTVSVLTLGGPNHASDVMLFTIYQEAFMFFRTSYAAAISVVFLFFIMVLTLIKIKFLDKRVHY